MTPRRILPLLSIGLLLLASCGSKSSSSDAGDQVADSANVEESRSTYPVEYQQQFISSCTGAAAGASGDSESSFNDYCLCALGEIEKRYTLEDFERYVTALATGEPTGMDLTVISRACGAEDSAVTAPPASPTGEFPEQVRTTFVDACANSAASVAGSSSFLFIDRCTCLLSEVEALYTYEEYLAADQAVRTGGRSKIDFTALAELCED